MMSARLSSVFCGGVIAPKTAGLLIKTKIVTNAAKIAVQQSVALAFSMSDILT